jgi:hypothetical protein
VTDFDRLLRVLADSHTEFILVGGVAAAAHGSARATYDIDIVYARTRENVERLVSALRPLEPYLRGAPPGLPFSWESGTKPLQKSESWSRRQLASASGFGLQEEHGEVLPVA